MLLTKACYSPSLLHLIPLLIGCVQIPIWQCLHEATVHSHVGHPLLHCLSLSSLELCQWRERAVCANGGMLVGRWGRVDKRERLWGLDSSEGARKGRDIREVYREEVGGIGEDQPSPIDVVDEVLRCFCRCWSCELCLSLLWPTYYSDSCLIRQLIITKQVTSSLIHMWPAAAQGVAIVFNQRIIRYVKLSSAAIRSFNFIGTVMQRGTIYDEDK